MLSARPVVRAAARAPRTVRPARLPQQRCHQSTASSAASKAQSTASSNSHFASGIAGGIVGSILLYTAYSFTPAGRTASKLNKAAKEANKKYQEAAATLQKNTPSTDDAINAVKNFCYSYVAWVPGGRQYVDAAFRDIETVREKNGDDVDKLVKDTYSKFQGIAKGGLSMETASKAYDALADLAKELGRLAGSAADQILENHPKLKEQVGEPMKQLKDMGEQYGPEAKRMVDETWDQVSDILKGGFSVQSAQKVKQLVEEKTHKLKEFGDKAWQKGMEQAKPYLDKSPKIKELVEKNQDLLKRGNASALFKQVKEAAESGDAGKLEDYVKQAVEKAKAAGGKASSSIMGSGASFAGLGQLLGGSTEGLTGEVQKHVETLSKLVNDHSDEAKKLAEETKNDLKTLLEEKAKKAQGIAESAQKSAKASQ